MFNFIKTFFTKKEDPTAYSYPVTVLLDDGTKRNDYLLALNDNLAEVAADMAIGSLYLQGSTARVISVMVRYDKKKQVPMFEDLDA